MARTDLHQIAALDKLVQERLDLRAIRTPRSQFADQLLEGGSPVRQLQNVIEQTLLTECFARHPKLAFSL